MDRQAEQSGREEGGGTSSPLRCGEEAREDVTRNGRAERTECAWFTEGAWHLPIMVS